ncbi:hypothetical protein K1T71_006228 [Dendrolimus kikuchii]|uniref:Uncharacterized protein n=1 Tax=Dendrolimus kikuchii TaxID=765133 RepID=A0ACC1D3K9_9NEOP|nr:hypothetical protein K1T71_006228 [Dendrolimus kikuchii]
MSLNCRHLIKIIRYPTILRHNVYSTALKTPENIRISKPKEYRTEENLIYLEDPDTFGTLSRRIPQLDSVEDVGDKKEEEFLTNIPLQPQKLTTKQYADLIKEYLKYKRVKEAIDVLEVRMLKEDRVKPENYIYNILIGACAEVGFTKKAFKLFNDMKRRALKPTGDTYTCLFEACSKSPWALDGLKNATHLRELMIEKGVEPNLTIYNVMIKAFGRCGDLTTAFKIIDEMISKKIKIRVHTFNHLLHACISDRNNGLRHALVVWRKMLKLKEKPNIYSFNLMLKCVKDCNLGSKKDIVELLNFIQEQIALDDRKIIQIVGQSNLLSNTKPGNEIKLLMGDKGEIKKENLEEINSMVSTLNTNQDKVISNENSSELSLIENNNIKVELVEKLQLKLKEQRVPNLLSRTLNLQDVTSLQEVSTLQEKFAVVGGQDDFLNIMQEYSIKPDIKTFAQMLPLIDDSIEAENKLLDVMRSLQILADIDFYNMLIKKRCMRLDYNAAVAVKKIIYEESEFRKKRYPRNKKSRLQENIMTYGVLALTCKSKESAEQLLNNMKEQKLKVNIEILGTLLRHGTVYQNFDYILYIMNVVKQENIPVNQIFLKHLETFNEKCLFIIKQGANSNQTNPHRFKNAYRDFSNKYSSWLKEVNVIEVLKPEHPWQQFREPHPETVQRENIEIKTPKRFYRRNPKYVKYVPKIV